MMWTDDEDKLLIQLWAAGKPSTYIAPVMGKSRGAIMGRISRLRQAGADLKARPRPPKRSVAYALNQRQCRIDSRGGCGG